MLGNRSAVGSLNYSLLRKVRVKKFLIFETDADVVLDSLITILNRWLFLANEGLHK